jgi:hypothetical protein
MKENPLAMTARFFLIALFLSVVSACGTDSSKSTSINFETEADRMLFEKNGYFSFEDAQSVGGFFDYADAKSLLKLGYVKRAEYEKSLRNQLISDFERNNKLRIYDTESCRRARETKAQYEKLSGSTKALRDWDAVLRDYCGTGAFDPTAPYSWEMVGRDAFRCPLPDTRTSSERAGGSEDLWFSYRAFDTLITLLPSIKSPEYRDRYIQTNKSLIVESQLNLADSFCGDKGEAHKAFASLSAFDKPEESTRIVAKFQSMMLEIEQDAIERGSWRETLNSRKFIKFLTKAKISVPDQNVEDGDFEFYIKDITPALINHQGFCSFRFENFPALDQFERLRASTRNESFGRSLEKVFAQQNSGEIDTFLMYPAPVWITVYAVVSHLDTEPRAGQDWGCTVGLRMQAIELSEIGPRGEFDAAKTIFFSDDMTSLGVH